MKVIELIEALKAQPQDADVHLLLDFGMNENGNELTYELAPLRIAMSSEAKARHGYALQLKDEVEGRSGTRYFADQADAVYIIGREFDW